MSEENHTEPVETNPGKQSARITYILFIAAAILGLAPNVSLFALSLIVGLVGIIKAYGLKGNEDLVYQTHGQWLVRTFWLGGGVLLPIATVVATISLKIFADDTAVTMLGNMMAAGNAIGPEIYMDIANQYMEDNKMLMYITSAVTFFPIFGWWFWRCGTGMNKAGKGLPIDNPKAFW